MKNVIYIHDDASKIQNAREIIFCNVWMIDDYMFMSIFHSP